MKISSALCLGACVALLWGCGSSGSSGTQGDASVDGAGASGGSSGSGGSGTGGSGGAATGGSGGAATGGSGGTATGGSGGTTPVDSGPDAPPLPADCNGSVASAAAPATGLPSAPALKVASGFSLELIATVSKARELAALPNGDLLVGTSGSSVYLVPAADRDSGAGKPVVYTTISDSPVQGVAFDGATCTVYVASQHGIYSIPYKDGDTSGSAGNPIAKVRQGGIPPGSDGDVHHTTSVAVTAGKVYAGVGSSCNACTEIDPTRATIQQMGLDGSNMSTRATRFRNAIALAINPATGTLWAGGAGQDSLPLGHPYEFFDAVTLHSGTADYGWPDCEEDQHAYTAGADCSKTVAPRVEMPAYSTIIGAAFYPKNQGGAHAFPQSYRGGVFLSVHGSWHKTNGKYYSPPRVAFVAMNGDTPATPVDWSDPSKQWKEFIGGFQLSDGVTRIARSTGIAVGLDGSLFFADDANGYVYRVRPTP